MRKEIFMEILLCVVSIGVIAGVYKAVSHENDNGDVHEYIIVGAVYTTYEFENQEPSCDLQRLPVSYGIVVGNKNYRGELGDVYYSIEYGTNICEYICEDKTKILLTCEQGENAEFLSVEFGIPYDVFVDNSANNIRQQMESSVGENNKGYMFDIKEQDDHIYYSYKKYINGIEATEGIEITVDNKGMVCKISKYIYGITNNEMDLTRIDEADKCIKEKIESEYGEGIEYEIVKKQWAYRTTDTINYYVSILGGDIVGYQVQWRDKIEKQGVGENCSWFYQADELNDICVVADEIQAAEDTLKRELLAIYGQDVKYEVERRKFSVVSNEDWSICYSVVINQDKMPLDYVVTCSHVYVDECEC